MTMIVPVVFYGTVIETEDGLFDRDVFDYRHHGSEIDRHTGWVAYWTMPGYMDRGDYSVFETESEAWADLIEQSPNAFCWRIGDRAAWIDLPSVNAARELWKDLLEIESGIPNLREKRVVIEHAKLSTKEIRDELELMGFTTMESDVNEKKEISA